MNPLVAFAVRLIRGYQFLSRRLWPAQCRFYPTCSAYTLTSLERFGLVRGTALALLRLGRCHPFHPGGVDPVPDL